MAYSHITAPTQYVEANGVKYAYRRFGAETGAPLVFLQHFRGGMDHWDPAVTDGLAAGRPVILFDNAGVAGSSGETPDTFDAMARCAGDFVNALKLDRVNLLGFSIGGFVAQSFVLQFPERAGKLILVGTGPRGGEPSQDAGVPTHARSTDPATGESPLEAFLYLFFSPSERGHAAGRAFWKRRHLRTKDVDAPSSQQTMVAQLMAMKVWLEVHGDRYAELKRIGNPALVVNGSNDRMIPTVNSFTLAQEMPNAQLILYPDSGHGSLFQYPDSFVQHAKMFLDAD
jgi:pimeloyl-ACP methyl ester carboxylesterase